jgi:cytochrome c-type biogenesis protein CcsB
MRIPRIAGAALGRRASAAAGALAILALLVPAAAPAQYIADTGRTERIQAPAFALDAATSESARAGAATTATAGIPFAVASAAATTATTATAIQFSAATAAPAEDSATATPADDAAASDFCSPEVERAITASSIGRVALQSEGITKAMNTFAEIMVHAVTGKVRYQGMDPLYVALGMIYQNREWMRVPMFPVEHPKLAEAFGLDPRKHHRVSGMWTMKNPRSRQLVVGVLGGADAKDLVADPGAQKALKKFAFRMATFMGMPEEFKLVPLANADGAWVSPQLLEQPDLIRDRKLASAVARTDLSQDPAAAAMALHAVLKKAFADRQTAGLDAAVESMLLAGDSSRLHMPAGIRKLDYFNTQNHPFQKAATAYLLAFIAFAAYLFLSRRAGKDAGLETIGAADGRATDQAPDDAAQDGVSPDDAGAEPSAASAPPPVMIRLPGTGATADLAPPPSRTWRGLWVVSFALMVVATLILVAALVIRFQLGQRMPVSNLYESITFTMGAFGIVALVFEGIFRRGWVGAGACLFGWGLMTMANQLPLHMRKVEPLVAVLNSFWLNYHVTSLLISYAAFLLSFVFCVLFLVKEWTGNRADGLLPRKEVFDYLNYRAVQVGWPLLTLGIFLGAVWANTAWGSAWSWDPKETWALITWLAYTVFLHLRMNLGWTGRRAVLASMVGFAMVLVTYFGVNYLPYIGGGMHSYAEPIAR